MSNVGDCLITNPTIVYIIASHKIIWYDIRFTQVCINTSRYCCRECNFCKNMLKNSKIVSY